MCPPELSLILSVILEIERFLQVAAPVVEIDLVDPVFLEVDEGNAARIARFLVLRAAFNRRAGQSGFMRSGGVLDPDMVIVGHFLGTEVLVGEFRRHELAGAVGGGNPFHPLDGRKEYPL